MNVDGGIPVEVVEWGRYAVPHDVLEEAGRPFLPPAVGGAASDGLRYGSHVCCCCLLGYTGGLLDQLIGPLVFPQAAVRRHPLEADW